MCKSLVELLSQWSRDNDVAIRCFLLWEFWFCKVTFSIKFLKTTSSSNFLKLTDETTQIILFIEKLRVNLWKGCCLNEMQRSDYNFTIHWSLQQEYSSQHITIYNWTCWSNLIKFLKATLQSGDSNYSFIC